MTRVLVTAVAVCLPVIAAGAAAAADGRFSNPIIPGFAPDPSVVRVGGDFYLINSTFEYFPGIPVYHSTDLVNWELIAYAIHEPSQADLARVKSSDGIHASTIRYHDGVFYVITTNNVDGKMTNFIVTATNPRGPWSAPRVLEGAPGIDPSLFFDDDGRAWYVGNHVPDDPEFDGQAEIWLQEVDLGEMRLIGERRYLWRGCCQGVWAEGPHIYKKDGYYYLLISEGGTSFEHALSVAISEDITGPYRNNPRNPVLSHRQLSYDTPITGVGHADIVELADGRWYAVALGWRLVDGRHGILGRETFLLPMTWETEPHAWKDPQLTFPVFSPKTGRVELEFPLPFSGKEQRHAVEFNDEFDGDALALEWNFRRAPARPFHSLDERPGSLRIYLQPGAIRDREPYSFVGIRQRHFEFEASTRLDFAPASGEEAGLAVIQNDKSAVVAALRQVDGERRVALTQFQNGVRITLAEALVAGGPVEMKVTGDYLDYRFYYSAGGDEWRQLGTRFDGTALSPATIPGYNYTGVYLGLYASANGAASDNYADFDFFHYRFAGTSTDDWYRRQETMLD